jgi:elongator complex protein 1
MALHDLHVDHSVIDVAINQFSNKVAVLDTTRLSLYDYDVTAKHVADPTISVEYPLPERCGTPVQVAIRGNSQVFMLSHNCESNQDDVFSFSPESSEWILLDLEMDHITNIFSSQSYDKVCIQDTMGLVLDAFPDLGVETRIYLPASCPWAEMVNFGDDVWSRMHISV